MDLLNYLTDDQIALMGCVAVLLFSMTLMYFSVYVGRLNRKLRTSNAVPVNRVRLSRSNVVHSRANRNSARQCKAA